MKKIFIVYIINILVISSFTNIINADLSPKDYTNLKFENITNEDFTHNVFVEYATTTWCPSCPNASEVLYTIYQSGDYPFFYVSLISDVNRIAKRRSRMYDTIVIPSIYIDGGDLNYFGNTGSIQEMEDIYQSLIELRGNNIDIKSIDIDADVIWNVDKKITVILTIKNNGDSPYFGIVRSYVTEIESRWKDERGNPYHFGFLDFAINRPIFLIPKKTKNIIANWNYERIHGGKIFEDITKDNILIISTISHLMPHLRQGYQDLPKYDQKYIGFFIDQAIGNTPR
jgi:hypothetical protein